MTGFDILPRREKGLAKKYIKEEKKRFAILQEKKRCRRKYLSL
jgi:hypothetical protein